TTLGQAPQNYTDAFGNDPLLYDCKQVDLDTNNDGSISSGENDRDSTISVAYEEYAMVVIEGDRLTGNVIWLPLKAKTNGPLTPLVANGACAQTSIDISATFSETGAIYSGDFSDYAIGNYLAPCVAVPERNRFSCFNDASGGGFIVLPGNTPLANASLDGPIQRQGTYNFRWEGILQGLDRTSGGGELVDEGTETQNVTIAGVSSAVPVTHLMGDVGLDYAAFQRVKPGDIIEILSAPTADPSCDAVLTQQYGSSREVCNFERHVVSVSTQADGTAGVRFDDPPIPVSCFLNQGRIAYKIRAGHQFLIDRNNQAAWRMDLADQFGPGGQTGTTEAVIFRLRSDLADTARTASACNRYDGNGSVLHQIPTTRSLDNAGRAPIGEECDGLEDGLIPGVENNQAAVDCVTALSDERDPNRDPATTLSSDLAYCNGYCQSGILGRLVGFSFTVYDPYRPYIGGRSYGSSGTATTASDSIPGDIISFQDQNSDPADRNNARLFITFAGSNTLVVLDPTNAQNATTSVQDVQLILRN
ncbi:MAG: hypothetical protein H7Z43_12615, partial [Clostridia bacterium]|nr:hypothetical protein [Deltaproteobacteria bacterium]